MKQAITEVVRDVKDEVGQMIEQGVQSVAGKQLTPQQVQQKQQEDQKELAKVRRNIAWYKNLDDSQKMVREQNRQKEATRLQNQQQEKQIIEVKKEEKKKQPIVNPALRWVGKFEKKGSIGG